MKKPSKRRSIAATGIAAAVAGLVGTGLAVAGGTAASASSSTVSPADATTATPIKHLVVLFDENVSYDHYFGTYPTARNATGDGVAFKALPNTPANNNLVTSGALTNNPNSVSPFRFDYKQALTSSQSHAYTDEQKAEDGDATTGKPAMDKFPESTAHNTCSAPTYCTSGTNMGYYDGNTVTGLWNLAQNFAMSDNSWDDDFGPSTNGALNLISGQTYGAVSFNAATRGENPTPAVNATDATKPVANNGNVSDNNIKSEALPTTTGTTDPAQNVSVGTVIGDPDPIYDDCAASSGNTAGMLGQNIGDVLNTKGLTWGWFQGGFTPTTPYAGAGTFAACTSTHNNIGGLSEPDYSPHHDPFQYYASTANPHHFPGTPGVAIGAPDPSNDTTMTGANHQYDLSVFDQAVTSNQLPAVSFVKAAEYQDGHPGNSDPIDEQHFLVKSIDEIEKSPEWSSTAIVIAYDDSDGWYDHQAPTILTGSTSADDQAVCTVAAAAHPAPVNKADGQVENGRCGQSQRLPFLVISPYSKQDYIDHTANVGQASVDKFIEYNWGTGTIDNAAVSGSFDTRDGSILNMFNFKAPHTTPVILNSNGTVASGGLKAPVPPKKPATPVKKTNTKLVKAKQKLAKDEKALKAAQKQVTAAQKAAKKAHGRAHTKAMAKVRTATKKVNAIKKTIAKDRTAVKRAS